MLSPGGITPCQEFLLRHTLSFTTKYAVPHFNPTAKRGWLSVQ